MSCKYLTSGEAIWGLVVDTTPQPVRKLRRVTAWLAHKMGKREDHLCTREESGFEIKSYEVSSKGLAEEVRTVPEALE